MSPIVSPRSFSLRRFAAVLLAVPACGLAYWAGLALGPSQSAGGQKAPPPF
jgi:hypothetical protein